MDKPQEKESVLLSVVLSDKVYWLHVIPEAWQEDREGQLPSILFPWLYYIIPLLGMAREVLNNHSTLSQIVNVEFHLKCLLNYELCLSTVEILKQVSSVALEWSVAVVDTKPALHFKQLSHQV